MRPDEKVACARAMLDNPLFTDLMNDMEKSAVDRCINALPIAHEERAAMAAEVRAIRKFRSLITSLIEEAIAPNTSAPA